MLASSVKFLIVSRISSPRLSPTKKIVMSDIELNPLVKEAIFFQNFLKKL